MLIYGGVWPWWVFTVAGRQAWKRLADLHLFVRHGWAERSFCPPLPYLLYWQYYWWSYNSDNFLKVKHPAQEWLLFEITPKHFHRDHFYIAVATYVRDTLLPCWHPRCYPLPWPHWRCFPRRPWRWDRMVGIVIAMHAVTADQKKVFDTAKKSNLLQAL